jgi:hypothetical protein
MMFALDIESGGLLAFPSTADAEAHCKPVDVEDGYWLFFSDDGSPLEARFQRASPSEAAPVFPGAYVLQRAMAGRWLHERLDQVKTLGGCGPTTIDELVDLMEDSRAKRAARGGRRE